MFKPTAIHPKLQSALTSVNDSPRFSIVTSLEAITALACEVNRYLLRTANPNANLTELYQGRGDQVQVLVSEWGARSDSIGWKISGYVGANYNNFVNGITDLDQIVALEFERVNENDEANSEHSQFA